MQIPISHKDILIAAGGLKKGVKIYPEGFIIKPIEDQIKNISQIFGLNPESALSFVQARSFLQKEEALRYVEEKSSLPENYVHLPDEADGWFALPQMSCFFPSDLTITEFKQGEHYCSLLNLILYELSRKVSFESFCSRERINSQNLKRNQKTELCLEKLESEQPGDIIIIPAQFGKRHAGISSKEVVEKKLLDKEFPFGAFEVGCMILTHLNRFAHGNELDVDCPGDIFQEDKEGSLLCCPNYFTSVKKIGFTMGSAEEHQDSYGSVTGFLF